MWMARTVEDLQTDAQKGIFQELLNRWLSCRKPVLKAGGGQQGCRHCMCHISSCCSSRKEDYSHRTPKRKKQRHWQIPLWIMYRGWNEKDAETKDHGAVNSQLPKPVHHHQSRGAKDTVRRQWAGVSHPPCSAQVTFPSHLDMSLYWQYRWVESAFSDR